MSGLTPSFFTFVVVFAVLLNSRLSRSQGDVSTLSLAAVRELVKETLFISGAFREELENQPRESTEQK